MQYSPYIAFGWVIHRVTAATGDAFKYEVRRSSAPSRLSAQTIYTKGRVSGVDKTNLDNAAVTRVPGFGNDQLPNPVPAVVMEMTAQEDSEWWCISAPTNPSLPVVEYIRLQAGESKPVQAGDLIFICDGAVEYAGQTLRGPIAVRVSSDAVLAALDAPVYGMKFDREGGAA